MKKALITGISGFAGSHLAEYLLSKGYDVSGIVHPNFHSNNLENVLSQLTIHELDLLDYDRVKKVFENTYDEVYHLAAFPSPADSFKNPAPFLMNNITGQVNVLEGIRNAAQTPKILVVASAEVYGDVDKKDLPIDEDTPLKPANPYAISKIAQDFMGLQYTLSYGMNIVRVRPFAHIGPRLSDKFVVSAFSKQIAEIEKGKKEPVLRVGNLNAKRDFTDVSDVVRAYHSILEKGENGDVYNIGSGVSHKISDILDMLLKATSKKIEVKLDKSLLRPIDIPDLVCDYSKLNAVTGWKPEIAIETSIKNTLEYWREQV